MGDEDINRFWRNPSQYVYNWGVKNNIITPKGSQISEASRIKARKRKKKKSRK